MRLPTRTWPTLVATSLLLVAACGSGSEPASSPPTTVQPSTTAGTVATTTTEPAAPEYVTVEPDPSLPDHDKIPFRVRYAAHLPPEAVPITQAWANFQHAVLSSLDPVDPASTKFDEWAVPKRAAEIRAGLQAYVDAGMVERFPENSIARDTVVDADVRGDRARILICRLIDTEDVVVATGAIASSGVRTERFRVAMTRIDGRWLADDPPTDSHRDWAGNEEDACLA